MIDNEMVERECRELFHREADGVPDAITRLRQRRWLNK